MMIVIQNTEGLLYLDADRHWTADGQRAMTFENFRVAVAYCAHHRLGKVRVVLQPDVQASASFPGPHAAEASAADEGVLALLALARAGRESRPPAFL